MEGYAHYRLTNQAFDFKRVKVLIKIRNLKKKTFSKNKKNGLPHAVLLHSKVCNTINSFFYYINLKTVFQKKAHIQEGDILLIFSS